MTPTDTSPTDDSPDIDDAEDRLAEVDEKVEEGREALDAHEPVDGDDDPDEQTFIQDGSIRTDLIDDAIRPAS